MLKYGNKKLGDDTAIFNMGTAKDCPSKQLGLCQTCIQGIKCYALKAEQQYPGTVPNARRTQLHYWNQTPADKILSDFAAKIERRRKPTRYFRFNEAGDFYTQEDVTKLSYIAEGLSTIDVVTYGYTARSDLDFTDAKFLVKGSNNDKGNNGRCIIVLSETEIPEGYIKCPGDCRKCNMCKVNTKLNIAFIKH